MNAKLWGIFAVVVILVAGIFGAIYIAPPAQNNPVETQYIQYYPKLRDVPEFTFTDQHGQPFTQDSLRSHWSLVFVGYTYCPDICPTTLASLARVYPKLQAIPSEYPLQVVFISVDPQRDSIARLNEFIAYFNQDFIAVTADHESLFPMTRSLGLIYALVDSSENTNYLVDHSASVVVVNPQGQVVGRFKPNTQTGELAVSDAKQIATDMPILLKGL